MAAHLRAIQEFKCQRCGKKATVRLHNTWNAPGAEYCKPCGARALKDFEDPPAREV